ncbi:MAG: DUF1573 domain-containing protein [Thiohalospira sp.]
MNNKRIIQLFFTILIFGLLSSCSNTTDKDKKNNVIQSNVKTTNLKFNNKYVNFGKLSVDTLVTARFDFKNTGSNPLIIYHVNPDCSCTDFYLSNDSVNPGDSAYIELVLNTEGKFGYQKIYAVVEANTKAKLYKLTLEADIQ